MKTLPFFAAIVTALVLSSCFHREDSLLAAAETCDVTRARTELSRGGNPNTTTWRGETPLMIAARKYGSYSLAKELIGAGANVNARNSLGQTALTIAEQNNNAPVVELLLSYGAQH